MVRHTNGEPAEESPSGNRRSYCPRVGRIRGLNIGVNLSFASRMDVAVAMTVVLRLMQVLPRFEPRFSRRGIDTGNSQ
jgi:hypothetical protein